MHRKAEFRFVGWLLLFFAAGPVTLYAAEPWRMSFNDGSPGNTLTFVGGAHIATLADPDRLSVVSLTATNARLDIVPGTLDFNLHSTNFTLSLMFKRDRLSATGTGSDENITLFNSDSALIVIRRGNDGGNAGLIYATLLTNGGYVLFKPGVRVDDGQWHTVTLRGTPSAGLVQIFLDGILYPDRNYSGTAMIFDNSLAFKVGAGSNTQVDEIRIFGRALSDAEVTNDCYAAVCGMGGLATNEIDHIRICVPSGQPDLCAKYANIFAKHIVRRAFGVQVTVETQYTNITPSANQLVIYLGVANADTVSQTIFTTAFGGTLPTTNAPGREGYALKLSSSGAGYTAWIAGVDERGVLYGLGRLLQLSKKAGPWASFPVANTNERSAPRYAIRDMGISEKITMDSAEAVALGARAWTLNEGITQWEELLLLGGNTLTHGRGRVPPVDYTLYTTSGGTAGVSLTRDERCVDYGVYYHGPQSVNGIGSTNMLSGWNATTRVGALDLHLGCPSIPAARARIVELWGIYAKKAQKLDYVTLQAADLAGCFCPICRTNWPTIFYNLCCDIADAIHVWKPGAKIYFTNQEMTADQNEKLFTLIQQDSGSPLAGYSYAPGGSENSTYGDNVINPVWERLYPDIDPDSTFLYSRLGYLQQGQDVLSLPDVTHWKRAGSAVRYPDPVWAETFSRRTYNARPAAYENLFREQMPYCNGMLGYSEGLFDDFNKYLLLRMLWNPALTAGEVSLEYYTYYCGEEAGRLLSEAVFIGEQIRERAFSVSRQQDIQAFYELVDRADACMPREYREGNWRYAQMKLHAIILQYVVHRYNELEEKYNAAVAALWSGVSNGTPSSAISSALDMLNPANGPPAASSGLFFALIALSEHSVLNIPLDDLMARAATLDDEVNAEIAIREFSLTKIASMDEVGAFWLKDQIETIQATSPDACAAASRLRDVLNYDQVGPGEFYDNCGTVNEQPHFDFSSGEFYYGSGGWPKETRPSQRWYDYSFEAQDGLEFSYEGLDTNATYEVTMTWPRPGALSFSMNSANEFYVYSDDDLIGQVLPPNEVVRYTFDIPRSATSDGAVQIKLRKVPGNARCTCISEIWLRKRPPDGLVARWDFEDGTYIDRIGSLNGAVSGTVSLVNFGNSSFSKAVQFGSSEGTDYLKYR